MASILGGRVPRVERPLRVAPALALIAALAAGCSARAPVRVPPTPEAYATAFVPGAPLVRSWGDDLDAGAAERGAAAVSRLLTNRWREAGRPAEGVDFTVLALSGGGPDGAFSAGLLNGWTEAGDRPVFDVVTGISVGALIAPFAYVGPEGDAALRKIFTELDGSSVAELALFSALMGALGLADTQPLRASLREFVDEAFLARVAEGHREGRQLLIGTTNIDAARPVLWNMGAIAEAGLIDLFREVMVASASIPGAFPPVAVNVTDGRKLFTEFHVDGGVTHSVILGPVGVEGAARLDLPFPVDSTIYVIQNNSLAPPFEPVQPRLTSIATRSLSTLIRGQSEGDLIRIHRIAEEIGADFRLTFVPPGFYASATGFDPEYMRALFERGRGDAADGVSWLDSPPGVIGRRQLLASMAAEAR
jgi:predicted acylesterase/phospholipase RssA